MSNADARVHIVNRALIKLGMAASYSTAGASDLAATVDMVWPGVEAHVVALYDWNAFKTTRKLTRLSTAPDNGWAYGFDLPADRIGEPLAILQQAGSNETFLRQFMLEGGFVFCNVAEAWARIRVMQDPEYWDAGFKEAFATALASALAVPLVQNTDDEAALAEKAFGPPQLQGSGGLFGRLLALNRAAEPKGRGFMNNDPLTSARW